MITEKQYPLLAWTGFALGEQPETLPIAAIDQRGYNFMATSKAFRGFIALFDSDRYQGTTLAEKAGSATPRPVGFYPARNLYLTPIVAKQLDSNEEIRNTLWRSLPNLPTVAGTIFWKVGLGEAEISAQYTYRILSVEDSLLYFKLGHIPPTDFVPNTRLAMVAVFAGDMLQGFEYGFLPGNGHISVSADSSYYGFPDADIGQYLSFTFITIIGWMKNAFVSKELKPGQGINQTRQPIIVVSHQ